MVCLKNRKRKGFSLVELLISLPLAAIVISCSLAILSGCLKAFEKSYFYAASPGWRSAERLFEFLDARIRHCGLGLPSEWDVSLFSQNGALSTTPSWAQWRVPVDVGESYEGSGFRSSGENPAGTLRLVSALPAECVLVQPFSAEAGDRVRGELSDTVKSSVNSLPASSASWLLIPGWNVPLRMVSDAATRTPVLEALRDVNLPAGAQVCRLSALAMWERNGVVFADFYDQSGAQPLFRNIDELTFAHDTDRRLLRVRVTISDSGQTKTELERSWAVVL